MTSDKQKEYSINSRQKSVSNEVKNKTGKWEEVR
jgi:hypothetical protein